MYKHTHVVSVTKKHHRVVVKFSQSNVREEEKERHPPKKRKRKNIYITSLHQTESEGQIAEMQRWATNVLLPRLKFTKVTESQSVKKECICSRSKTYKFFGHAQFS